jgi:hypothetical protein
MRRYWMIYSNRVKPATSSMEREERMEKSRSEAERDGRAAGSQDAFRANYERLKAERLARETKKS